MTFPKAGDARAVRDACDASDDCVPNDACEAAAVEAFDDRPIGVFDSGYGGLTVARALQKRLPEESLVYFGDSARCPYGPRDQAEVDRFVQQICTWLVGRDVKPATRPPPPGSPTPSVSSTCPWWGWWSRAPGPRPTLR